MSSCIKPNGTIDLTRGDSFYAIIKLDNCRGYDVNLQEGDKLRFAMKEDFDCRGKPILDIEIPIDTMTLRIAPEDTKYLPCGTYVYDVQLTFPNGDVDTVIARKRLNLLEEIA